METKDDSVILHGFQGNLELLKRNAFITAYKAVVADEDGEQYEVTFTKIPAVNS